MIRGKPSKHWVYREHRIISLQWHPEFFELKRWQFRLFDIVEWTATAGHQVFFLYFSKFLEWGFLRKRWILISGEIRQKTWKNEVSIDERKKYWRNNRHIMRWLFKSFRQICYHEVSYMQSQITAADELILKGTGAGSDFLGCGPSWKLPAAKEPHLLSCWAKSKSDNDVLVVISIGGSYLECQAAIDFLNHHFFLQTKKERKLTNPVRRNSIITYARPEVWTKLLSNNFIRYNWASYLSINTKLLVEIRTKKP